MKDHHHHPMDEKFQALASIIHGCELAKQLESNLATLASQPNSLLSSCEEISRAFSKAIALLDPAHDYSSAYYTHAMFGGAPTESSSKAQYMDRGSYTQAMDIFYSQALERSPFDAHLLPERSMGAMEPVAPVGGVNAGEAEASGRPRPIGELQASDTSDSGGSTSIGGTSVARARKRKDSSEVRTIRVSAPRMGNSEIPPDDGFTWRKYGQKEILNSRFPRSYYRCTHRNFYGCDAKKQVQRLDDDPYTFEVMYRGNHTCHTSPTPLILHTPDTRPAPEVVFQPTPQPPAASLAVSTSIQLGPFFPRELDLVGPAPKHKNAPMDFSHVGSGGQRGEPSHVQGGKDQMMEFPVLDLAAAMFNPRSSTSDDIDAIFSSKKEK